MFKGHRGEKKVALKAEEEWWERRRKGGREVEEEYSSRLRWFIRDDVELSGMHCKTESTLGIKIAAGSDAESLLWGQTAPGCATDGAGLLRVSCDDDY